MGKALYIFDFDDTLVDSGAKVKVVRADNSVDYYSSRQYRDYDRKYKQPGDVLNFDEFDVDPPDASVIQEVWDEFLSALSNASATVIILTARANPVPVKEFLEEKGVNPIPPIEAVGDSNPDAKKEKVVEYINNSREASPDNPDKWITDIYLWEDSLANIKAIESLSAEMPELRFTTELVTETTLQRFVRELLREILWK